MGPSSALIRVLSVIKVYTCSFRRVGGDGDLMSSFLAGEMLPRPNDEHLNLHFQSSTNFEGQPEGSAVGENSPPEDEERWTDGSEASDEAVEAGKSRKRKHNRVSDSNPFGTKDNTPLDSAAKYKKSRCDNSLDSITPSTAQTHNTISGTFLGQHFDPDYHEIKPDDEDDNGNSISKSIEAQIPLSKLSFL